MLHQVPARPSELVYTSRQMARAVELARRAGESQAKVLITGESGVGKDLLAREIHRISERRARQFMAVNCAGLPETLLESELFGHVRGSFTGAYRDRPGKLQQADGGTLFLDEVGEMSLRMQALLLRFLESGELQTVGDTQPRTVDVRIIAATNRNLPERVAAGEFREDLLYRLRVIQISVPPLRERPEDIPALVEHFLTRSRRKLACTPETNAALLRYRWPGNVRELQNVIEQAVWLADGSTISPSDLPEALRSPANVLSASRERRRQIADQLFDALVQGQYSFWDHVHPLFLDRDLTRHDIRELVGRGLSATKGNYRALLKLFGMDASDYYRFHNFLTAHGCKVDFRAYRTGVPMESSRPPGLPKVS
ncbi:MAG TPA: sigma 54-interacting transcriptional regulator [Vicinamibacterales bacterium]|nr:sigma 54-interacting transcriptional regulator [Vicinamibacterales bacterium]